MHRESMHSSEKSVSGYGLLANEDYNDQGTPPELIQHVLTVLVFWSQVRLVPGSQLRLEASDGAPQLACASVCEDLLAATLIAATHCITSSHN